MSWLRDLNEAPQVRHAVRHCGSVAGAGELGSGGGGRGWPWGPDESEDVSIGGSQWSATGLLKKGFGAL